MLIKVKPPPGKRSEIRELAEIFRGRIVDVAPDEVMIEISGQEKKIEAFIELMRPFGIIELVRTGRIAMVRGGQDRTPSRRCTGAERRQPLARDVRQPIHSESDSPRDDRSILMPAKIYYDNDADLALLKDKTIAILGYGSQGHAHAQNLRDSGCNVIVGQRPGSANYDLAKSHGFEPVSRRRGRQAGRHRQHPAARRSAGRRLPRADPRPTSRRATS